MKKLLTILLLILPTLAFSEVAGVKNVPNAPFSSGPSALFVNRSTVGTGTSFYIGGMLACHTWTIIPTKTTVDVVAKVQIEGSLDDSNYYSLDTYSSNTNSMRHIANKGVSYYRARYVSRVYTGIRPKLNVKAGSCN